MHLKQQILQGALKHGALIFMFLTRSQYIFGAKLQPKNVKNNMVFTPLKLQVNSSCIFVDIQQKVQSQKCPITYW